MKHIVFNTTSEGLITALENAKKKYPQSWNGEQHFFTILAKLIEALRIEETDQKEPS